MNDQSLNETVKLRNNKCCTISGYNLNDNLGSINLLIKEVVIECLSEDPDVGENFGKEMTNEVLNIVPQIENKENMINVLLHSMIIKEVTSFLESQQSA